MFAPLSKLSLGASLCMLAFFSAFTNAGQTVQGGVIHFMGQIVEDPCEINAQRREVEMSCPRDGRMQTNRYSLKQVTSAPQHFQQISSVKMQYINKEKTLAIMNIEYR